MSKVAWVYLLGKATPSYDANLPSKITDHQAFTSFSIYQILFSIVIPMYWIQCTGGR